MKTPHLDYYIEQVALYRRNNIVASHLEYLLSPEDFMSINRDLDAVTAFVIGTNKDAVKRTDGVITCQISGVKVVLKRVNEYLNL